MKYMSSWKRRCKSLSETLRTLKKGGTFAIHDIFLNRNTAISQRL